MPKAYAKAPLPLIPQPDSVEQQHGFLILSDQTEITYNKDSIKETASLIASQLQPATGFPFTVAKQQKSKKSKIGNIALTIVNDDSLEDEGYRLTVSDQILIEAQTNAGLFYGAQTLRQLLPAAIFSDKLENATWIVPKVIINDTPEMQWRGMHLDVSRHMFPKEDILRFIDTIASFKLNSFHMHLTDDQGWRIEIKKYPKLTEIGGFREETMVGHLRNKPRKYDGKPYGGFYTQEDIKEIVAYATARHINVVPEIDMPGHMQAAIAAYPEFGTRPDEPTKVLTKWGISANILNMEDKTVQFTKDVLTEVMALFPSKYIHIGGDEAAKAWWKKSERIQWHIKDKGLKNENELQSWFIQEIDNFLQGHDRNLIGWDEIVEGGIAKDATLMWWKGVKTKDHINQAATDGHKIVIADKTALYFDHRQDRDVIEPLNIGGWAPLHKVYHYKPFRFMNEQQKSMVLGIQAQLWTEYIPNVRKLERSAFPRAWALSEVAWSDPKTRDWESFQQRVPTQEIRFIYKNMNFRKTLFGREVVK